MYLENVKIISKRNRPIAVLKFKTQYKSETSGYFIYNRMKKRINSYNTDKYRYVEMPIAFLEDFISINKRICGEESDVVFDDKSIEIFYGYAIRNSIHYFCKLVDSVIKTWVNHDCPDLIRYTVNTKREKNWAGLNLLFWSDVVYQDDGYNVSVDELLEDEYNAFEKAMNHNWYCWEKINEAWNNQHSEQNADEVLAAVRAYEFEVQEMINTYQPELETYKATLEEVPMDCGFTMIYTSNEMINKHISFLKSRDIRSVDYLEVSFPYDYFSVSNSYKIFEKFKSLSAGNPLMSELSVRTGYD